MGRFYLLRQTLREKAFILSQIFSFSENGSSASSFRRWFLAAKTFFR
jgi:hypothetical protein